MKIDKIKILVLILLAFIGYFFRIMSHKSDELKSKQAVIPPINYNLKTSVFNPLETIKGSFFSQEEQVYNATDEMISPLFKNIRETAKTAIQTVPVASSSFKITKPTPMPTSTSTSVPTEIILSLTDDEFHFLYPKTFIKSLIDAQNLFVKNIDPSYELITNIETDAQVRFIEEKMVVALVSMKMLTEEEGGRAITTIRYTLPKMQLEDLKTWRRVSWNRYFNFPQPAPSPSRELFLFGLIKMLRNALAPNVQAESCGECHDLPECYQVGSSSPTPGANLFKAFCSCSGCYYGEGCLDSCPGGSAIFDIEEFICGCGY